MLYQMFQNLINYIILCSNDLRTTEHKIFIIKTQHFCLCQCDSPPTTTSLYLTKLHNNSIRVRSTATHVHHVSLGAVRTNGPAINDHGLPSCILNVHDILPIPRLSVQIGPALPSSVFPSQICPSKQPILRPSSSTINEYPHTKNYRYPILKNNL